MAVKSGLSHRKQKHVSRRLPFGSNLIFVPKAGQEQQAETKLQQAYEEQGITAEPFSVKKQIEEYYNGQETFIFVLIFLR